MEKLVAWRARPDRRPLVVRGARQVGKTWLMKEFGRTHYAACAYVNFEGNERMQRLFAADLNPARIIEGIELEVGWKIDAAHTLIIFDEVQEVPRALTALKCFCEEAPGYHVMAAGSLLGVALHPGTSFPVGKVEFLDLHPLSFEEFLMAIGQADHLELIRRREWDTVAVFKDRFKEWLRQYVFVGGMPEAAGAFIARRDYGEVRQIQERVLAAYELDLSKHAPADAVPRIRQLWQSVPAQLARENRKFVYGAVRPGARAREYELAMAWLVDSGLIHKVSGIAKPGLPLAAYETPGAFKLFALDVGLLAALSRLDAATLLDGSRMFEEFKGALTEQYVLQQLLARGDLAVHYWATDVGTAEVDFVIQCGTRVLPVEVKAGENLQAKSLKVYHAKFAPPTCLRVSLSDYRRESWLINVPLYGLAALGEKLWA